jgi:hypothetical protein
MSIYITILDIYPNGFALLLCKKVPYEIPWILFGIFKYQVHMEEEPEWTIALGYYRINLKWLWNELKKKRTLRI